MKALSSLPSYRLVNIGPRGVGKTAFLAACFLASHRDSGQQRELWLEKGSQSVGQTLDHLLGSIADRRTYPPATEKITPFDLVLKQKRQWGQETLGWVQWWDLPGDWCQLNHPEMQVLLGQADGVCCFVSGPGVVANVYNPLALHHQFQPLLDLLTPLRHRPSPPPIALVVTQCDQIPPCSLPWQQLHQGLASLLHSLDPLPYQVFYGEIPLTERDGIVQLHLKRPATPVFWLFSQIYRLRHPDSLSPTDSAVFYRPTPLPPWLPAPVRHWGETVSPRQWMGGLLLALGGLALILTGLVIWVVPSGRSPSHSPDSPAEIKVN